MSKKTKEFCDALGIKNNDRLKIYNKEDFKNLKIPLTGKYSLFNLNTEIPILYFKELSSYDENYVRDLHRKVWNEGKVPVLIIILPQEIRVYNTFIPAFVEGNEFNEKALISILKFAGELASIKKEISEKFSFISQDEIASGNFWKNDKLNFKYARKIDDYLIENLEKLRERLSKKLDYHTINKLIIRCIFIAYMQDREILTNDYFKKINSNCSNFKEILKSKRDTYNLFNEIYSDFNGNVFNVEKKEFLNIDEEILNQIFYFLEGFHFLEKGIQKSLLPYSFDTIPIELISSIYEQFLHENKDKKDKTSHYTPHFLVNMSLDNFYKDKKIGEKKILDASCGSGIFLVESFQRIVLEAQKKENITWATLKKIVENQIYGVDINEDAILIAIFSLYLKMLDFMHPKNIWKKVKFPNLLNKNLIVSDFFSDNLSLNKIKFDYFIGNPPWESLKKNSLPVQYCSKRKYPLGDNQLAQAFIWKIKDLSLKNSKSCLILPAKSFLFNTSSTNINFRKSFFKNHDVKTILNLSAMRKDVFSNAIGPASVIYYNFSGSTQNVAYISPKLSKENKNSPYILVDSSDIHYLNINKIMNFPFIWKTFMWGNSIDLDIMEKLTSFQKLDYYLNKNNMISKEGFIRGGGEKNYEPRLKGMNFVDPRKITSFKIEEKAFTLTNEDYFHRPRSKHFSIYKAPHLLIRKNKVISAYLENDCSFTHAIYGIHSEDKNKLKFLSCLINSHLARYYFFLSSSAWGVERDNVHSGELKNFPVPDISNQMMKEIVRLHDLIVIKIKEDNFQDYSKEIKMLNNLIFNIYGLTEIEKYFIGNTLFYDLDLFRNGASSKIYEISTILENKNYVKIVNDRLDNILKYDNKFMNSIVYRSKNPFILIEFKLSDKKQETIFKDNLSQELLKNIKELIYSKIGNNLSLKKDLIIYLNDRIILIKSKEKKYWRFKKAIEDSNKIWEELISTN